MPSTVFYPTSPRDELVSHFVGKSLQDVPTPAAVLDVAAARRNCRRMLEACASLDLGWRAHVKTHKTAELTRLQVGDDVTKPVKIVVSTLAEAEFLLPLLNEYKSQGRAVNVLYGLPISPNAVPRLSSIATSLGEGSISILLDDPSQLDVAKTLQQTSGIVAQAHVKIDMGGRRAGVVTDSDRFYELVDAALSSHKNGNIVLSGLYSHAGHSYGGDSRAAAIKMLGAELSAMLTGADSILKKAADRGITHLPSLVLSAGASPTAISVQNLLSAGDESTLETTPGLKSEAESLSKLFSSIRDGSHAIEIHAGVYPTLDLQQLAAHSVSTSVQSWRDIALTVLAEVHGTYPGRGDNGTTEVLVGAGGLALGREFCKAYSGMAMLTPWGRPGVRLPECDVEDFEGWIVGRFSQEHGILTWQTTDKAKAKQDELKPGQKVRLWPNHACITSSHFGWYFVVDEDRTGKEDEIVDIWVKARGW